MSRGIVLFAIIGVGVLVLGITEGDGWAIGGGALVALGIVPLRLSDRADVPRVGRAYVGTHLRALGWLLVAIACFVGGLALVGLGQ